MAQTPIYDSSPSWLSGVSDSITLYHGCTDFDRLAIESGRIDPKRGNLHVDVRLGRINTDFGRGFYTTTVERQARQWAWQRYYDPKFKRKTGNSPTVLVFKVQRSELAKLKSLCFALAGYNSSNGYWSLVQHCRQSDPNLTPPLIQDHDGPVSDGANRWFDICYGVVSAFWRQQVAMLDADQVSFHTDAAASILDSLIKSQSNYRHYVVT
jgi:Protein of unknown function (DUF3990)